VTLLWDQDGCKDMDTGNGLRIDDTRVGNGVFGMMSAGCTFSGTGHGNGSGNGNGNG